MTTHWFGPKGKSSKGEGHPVMFGGNEAEHYGPFPDGGGYPKRFLKPAYQSLGVTDPELVLHLCSGSMQVGVRVDIRPEMNPTITCDCRNTPFPDESFDWIMADPPYTQEYAENLYGTGEHFPKPGQILREAARLLRPKGRVGLLHFEVPMFRKPLKLISVKGITTGCGYAIRAWSVLEKGTAGDESQNPSEPPAHQPEAIRAELIGSRVCKALGITARDYAPALTLCRLLVEAGHDPNRPLHAYRSTTLAFIVRSLAEGAERTVQDDRLGRPRFVRRRPRSDGAGSHVTKSRKTGKRPPGSRRR